MRALQARLGARDRAKVANYLDDVREIERRIQRSEAQQRADVTMIKPLGIPDSFEEHCSLMTDLIAVGLQAELTNVFTFMMSREGSQRTFSNIGISDPWHVTSHHGDKPEKIANNAKINVFCLQTFARLLEKLRATPDGDGTMLDHSLIFFGSGMANSNVHATDPLPMVAVGGGAGTKGNRHIVLPKETQLGNLWLSRRESLRQPDEQVRGKHRHRRVLLMRFAAALLVLAIAVPARAAGPEPALVAAMKTGDVAAVRTLVERKVDINATEADGTSALHWAVRAGDLADHRVAHSSRRTCRHGQPLRCHAALACRAHRSRRFGRPAADIGRQHQDGGSHTSRGTDARDAGRADGKRRMP